MCIQPLWHGSPTSCILLPSCCRVFHSWVTCWELSLQTQMQTAVGEEKNQLFAVVRGNSHTYRCAQQCVCCSLVIRRVGRLHQLAFLHPDQCGLVFKCKGPRLLHSQGMLCPADPLLQWMWVTELFAIHISRNRERL